MAAIDVVQDPSLGAGRKIGHCWLVRNFPFFQLASSACEIHQRHQRERWPGCGKMGEMGQGKMGNSSQIVSFFSDFPPISYEFHTFCLHFPPGNPEDLFSCICPAWALVEQLGGQWQPGATSPGMRLPGEKFTRTQPTNPKAQQSTGRARQRELEAAQVCESPLGSVPGASLHQFWPLSLVVAHSPRHDHLCSPSSADQL